MARPATGMKDLPDAANPGPPEDITPVDTLPAAAQQPEQKPTPGWQSPPISFDKLDIPCPHIGRIRAVQQVYMYELGTEWACTCGQLFVVAVNRGDKKTLRKKEDVLAEFEAAASALEEPVVEDPPVDE